MADAVPALRLKPGRVAIVAALAGVATRVLSIDSSADAIDLARENLARNPALPAERAARAYKDVNLLALKRLRPGGLLATFRVQAVSMPASFARSSRARRSMPARTPPSSGISRRGPITPSPSPFRKAMT